ncbi:growth-blocking peptide, long form-like [Cydia fagiglandana]|uniref:growth-blocking peptide, long form-like n=1 Tax=Cydia fagiglandana TaxID=1458189 RepID=UPI002FEDFA93
MKLPIAFVCCFISTILYTVDGGLVKDFFGKVKDTAEVIHKDVHSIWRPGSGNVDKNNKEETVTTPATPSAAKDGHDEKDEKKEGEQNIDEKPKDTKASEITPSSSTMETKEHETKEDKHEETTTAASETTTKKDERANFSGACQANYRRTADGRCMLVGA